MTTRGFGVEQAEQVGHLIADVLDAPGDATRIAMVREKVERMTAEFPVYG